MTDKLCSRLLIDAMHLSRGHFRYGHAKGHTNLVSCFWSYKSLKKMTRPPGFFFFLETKVERKWCINSKMHCGRWGLECCMNTVTSGYISHTDQKQEINFAWPKLVVKRRVPTLLTINENNLRSLPIQSQSTEFCWLALSNVQWQLSIDDVKWWLSSALDQILYSRLQSLATSKRVTQKAIKLTVMTTKHFKGISNWWVLMRHAPLLLHWWPMYRWWASLIPGTREKQRSDIHCLNLPKMWGLLAIFWFFCVMWCQSSDSIYM